MGNGVRWNAGAAIPDSVLVLVLGAGATNSSHSGSLLKLAARSYRYLLPRTNSSTTSPAVCRHA
jgi:hypothetical protein